jgi:ketosteroid isomerase-like protein
MRAILESFLQGLAAACGDIDAAQATVADVFTVENGQVVRMRAYADPSEVPA